MRIPLLFASALTLTAAASAQVVASDTFSYVGLLTANGWANHSGTGFFIPSDGVRATLSHGAGSREDANLPFPAFSATDTMYASFTMNVPSTNPVNPDSQGTYFVHFKDLGSNFRARTGVLSPAGGGDFGLAINADSANLGAGAIWPVDLAFDTDYTVVISWDAATDTSVMWVNPVDASSPSVTHSGVLTGAIMEQFALRQSNDHTGDVYVDNVVVGFTFADVACTLPGSIAMMDTPACSTASMTVTGSSFAGDTFVATVNGATLPMTILGFSNVNAPLFFFGCGCVLVPNLDVINLGTTLTVPVPGTVAPGFQVFIQGAELTGAGGVSSPCDLGGGLFVGLTSAACVITG